MTWLYIYTQLNVTKQNIDYKINVFAFVTSIYLFVRFRCISMHACLIWGLCPYWESLGSEINCLLDFMGDGDRENSCGLMLKELEIVCAS